MTTGEIWQLVIGVLGLVVSAVTLGFVLADRAARRRQVTWPTLGIGGLATVSGEHQAGATHRVWFANSGGAAASILNFRAFGFEWALTDTPLPRAVEARSSTPIDIKTDDFDQAWMLVTFIAETDSRRVIVQWMPLSRDGALADERHRQMQAVPLGPDLISRIRRARAVRGQHVGPGGAERRSKRGRPQQGDRMESFFIEVAVQPDEQWPVPFDSA